MRVAELAFLLWLATKGSSYLSGGLVAGAEKCKGSAVGTRQDPSSEAGGGSGASLPEQIALNDTEARTRRMGEEGHENDCRLTDVRPDNGVGLDGDKIERRRHSPHNMHCGAGRCTAMARLVDRCALREQSKCLFDPHEGLGGRQERRHGCLVN